LNYVVKVNADDNGGVAELALPRLRYEYLLEADRWGARRDCYRGRVTTIEDLARSLGGVVRVTAKHRVLDTQIGRLRAAVIRRHHVDVCLYDLAVFSPDARELDALHHHDDIWHLDREELPLLRDGYVFAGCRGGVLFARATKQATLEDVVATLWELAHWARKPWRLYTAEDYEAELARERRERRKRILARAGVVAGVVLVAAALRRPR